MTQTPTIEAQALEGKMFLYEQPELLTVEEHGRMGLSTVPRPFEFVRHVRAVPLVSLEFSSAQKDYPIVFSDTDVPMPLAVVGIAEDVNLFVDDAGNWERPHYIPFYVRCHPFGFARGQGDQLAVVIDRAARSVTENPEEPFFDGNKLTEKMQQRVDFSARYSQERQRTTDLGRRLKELGLFTGQQVKHRPQGGEEQPLGTYVAVDVEKLGKLDSTALQQLHADGSLSAIYAHVFSLENWNRLLERRAGRARQQQMS